MSIIRILAHPTTELVLLDVPPQFNQTMRLFEPARLAVDLHGFLIRPQHLPAFCRFADLHGLDWWDERRTPTTHPSVEELCDRCGLPEARCEKAAGNRGRFKDHDFTTQAMGELSRHPRRHA